MYLGVSNGQYKSSQTTGMRTRSSPSLLLKHPTKCPELSRYGIFTSEGYGEARKAKNRDVKKQLPENPSYTIALQREKLPLPPNLSAEATFVSFGEERMERKGKKKNALGKSWGSDKGLKRGVAFKFRGPTGLQRAIPSETGTRALFASGWEPKLPQLRDGDPWKSPVSSTVPE